VADAAEKIYRALGDAGVEVLIDDREGHRPGAKFADAELIGFPHRIVVGDRGLENGVIEYMDRREGESRDVPIEAIVDQVVEQISASR